LRAAGRGKTRDQVDAIAQRVWPVIARLAWSIASAAMTMRSGNRVDPLQRELARWERLATANRPCRPCACAVD
jgi:hypothetical protein